MIVWVFSFFPFSFTLLPANLEESADSHVHAQGRICIFGALPRDDITLSTSLLFFSPPSKPPSFLLYIRDFFTRVCMIQVRLVYAKSLLTKTVLLSS